MKSKRLFFLLVVTLLIVNFTSWALADSNRNGVPDDDEGAVGTVDSGASVRGKIYPFSFTVPNECGSECGCGSGAYYVCTDSSTGPIVAYYNTRRYVGKKAKLIFKTEITPYTWQNVSYEVWIDGVLKFSDSFSDCPGPTKKVVEFNITNTTTTVEWKNVSSETSNWLIIGTDDCNTSTLEAYIKPKK